MKSEARNYVATHSGVLDDKRADFHRRKESLEKLEEQLAAYRALLEEEDREAKERLESARLAKAEFEEREGAEEDARAAELQTKKKQLVKELGEVDLQIVQHEDEGLENEELETKKSELEEAIVKVDTELRQMRERADRRAKLAEFNKGELEREKAAKAKKALQEKLRADKKAEIMDRMRRKQQEEEEKREKDEIEAQKQREVRARRPAVPRRFHAIDATRLHQTRYSDRVTTATPRADRGRETGRVRPREDGSGRSEPAQEGARPEGRRQESATILQQRRPRRARQKGGAAGDGEHDAARFRVET